jgi:hypothetical protein
MEFRRHLAVVVELGFQTDWFVVSSHRHNTAEASQLNLETAVQPTKHTNDTNAEGLEKDMALTLLVKAVQSTIHFGFASLVVFVGSIALSRLNGWRCLKNGWNGLPARAWQQLAAKKRAGLVARRNRQVACSTRTTIFGQALSLGKVRESVLVASHAAVTRMTSCSWPAPRRVERRRSSPALAVIKN